MRVHLIAPSNEDSTHVKPLWAATLAAHTPPDVEVTFHDAGIEPVSGEEEAEIPDLVGISVSSKTAAEAYGIADRYRRRGSRVVLGGVHVTALPEEGLEHADALVLGEAEWIWQEVVQDAQRGQLRPRYRNEHWPSLEGLPLPRRDLFKSIQYVPFDVVQTSRGCPYPCEFCSVSTYNGPTYRFRPNLDVIRELERVGPRVLFGDDNVMIHTGHGRALLEAMIPLRKTWVAQASLAGLHDPGSIELLARAGCKALFIGFEAVSADTLRGMGKRQNRPVHYMEVVRRLADCGIAVWGSFVFGFDEDRRDSFDRTVEFCIEARITVASFAVLTPYPGTRLYARLKGEGRLHDRWWLDRDHNRNVPHFRPRHMTREELRAGWVKAWLDMYSMPSIYQRYDFRFRHSWIQNYAYWPMNLMMRELAEKKIAGGRRSYRKHRKLNVPFGF